VSSSLQSESEVSKTWKMARNCAMSPRQFVFSYCSLVGVSLSVAGLCAASGAWVVIFFAGTEMLGIAVLFLHYARHATDYDEVKLSSERLLIECTNGPRIERYEFNPHWARINLQTGLNPMIEIRYAGKCVIVGSHLPAYRRSLIADELRKGLSGITAAQIRDLRSSTLVCAES
jgi:uncharacterized membrane protein